MIDPYNDMKTVAEQQETLDKPINQSGEGEDPAIKALLSEEFIKMNDTYALSVALAVTKIVRGQVQAELDGSLSTLKGIMAKMEETARKSEEDRIKWAEKIFNDAEKLRKGATEETVVKGAELLAQAQAEAQAEAAEKRYKIDQRVLHDPKIRMTHPGLPTTYRMQGQKRVIMKPFEIRYEHLVFELEPGVPTEVPLFIYELFQDQQELAAKRDVLKSTLADGTQHYGKAIAADPSVDPNYEDQINQSVNQKGLASLQGV